MGHIAVLDEDAADLLERFRFPTSLSTLHMDEVPEQASTCHFALLQTGFSTEYSTNFRHLYAREVSDAQCMVTCDERMQFALRLLLCR